MTNYNPAQFQGDQPEPRRLEDDELHRCRRCGHEACRCPSLEDAPYGSLAGEPGYVP